jgi:hypothetical protein
MIYYSKSTLNFPSTRGTNLYLRGENLVSDINEVHLSLLSSRKLIILSHSQHAKKCEAWLDRVDAARKYELMEAQAAREERSEVSRRLLKPHVILPQHNFSPEGHWV